MKDTFIFDFDGTLADSMSLGIEYYNKYATSFGAKLFDPAKIEWARGQTYQILMKEFGLNYLNLPILGYLVKRALKKNIKDLNPFPGIKEALLEYKKQNIQLGILTSNRAESVNEFMNIMGIDVFDFIVSEKSIFGKDKGLTKIMQSHNLKVDQIVYFGDEPRDVEACHKVGIKVVGVAWGFAGKTGLAQNKPDLLLEKPVELITRLEEIRRL